MMHEPGCRLKAQEGRREKSVNDRASEQISNCPCKKELEAEREVRQVRRLRVDSRNKRIPRDLRSAYRLPSRGFIYSTVSIL